MPLRYVGVIQLAYDILQLLPFGAPQQNLYCVSKFTMKHQQNLAYKSDVSQFNHSYHKCMFVDSLTQGSSHCVHSLSHIECEIVNKF